MLFEWLLCLLWGVEWLVRRLAYSLKPRARRRQASPSVSIRSPVKPTWVRHEVMRLKALMPEAGCRRIADTFNRRFACHKDFKRRASVGKSFVAEAICTHRYQIEVLRRSIKHRLPLAVPRNLIWAMDLTGKTETSGNAHAILGLIDHGSRALLSLTGLANKSSWTLLGHLFLAIGKYGKPRLLRTDNEAVFVSRLFRAALWFSGICHQRTDPGCPWQNGRIERLFGTLKENLDRIEVDCFAALNSALDEFSFFYNFVRPHQHLHGRTPAEAWAGVDPFRQAAKREFWFEAWEGLLCGYYLRR